MSWMMGKFRRYFIKTMEQLKNNDSLLSAVVMNRQTADVYSLSNSSESLKRSNEEASVSVINASILEITEEELTKYREVAVLANADMELPFKAGWQMAQIGELCRNTTLFPALCSDIIMNKFYNHNRSKKKIFSDRLFYIPEVVVFNREWGGYQRFLTKENWGVCNIVGASAPRLQRINEEGISNEEVIKSLKQQIDNIFRLAAQHSNEVIVLSAFGCGACNLDPYMVAEIFYILIDTKWKWYFKEILFAITDKGDEDTIKTNNYAVFSKIFKE